VENQGNPLAGYLKRLLRIMTFFRKNPVAGGA
jgi:hypothetical protein